MTHSMIFLLALVALLFFFLNTPNDHHHFPYNNFNFPGLGMNMLDYERQLYEQYRAVRRMRYERTMSRLGVLLGLTLLLGLLAYHQISL